MTNARGTPGAPRAGGPVARLSRQGRRRRDRLEAEQRPEGERGFDVLLAGLEGDVLQHVRGG
jgi:hypothetical protein